MGSEVAEAAISNSPISVLCGSPDISQGLSNALPLTPVHLVLSHCYKGAVAKVH